MFYDIELKELNNSKYIKQILSVETEVDNYLKEFINYISTNFLYRIHIKSIILVGSASRGEAVINLRNNSIEGSDIDILAVTTHTNPFLDKHLNKICKKMFKKSTVEIDVNTLSFSLFKKQKTKFMHDLIHNGKVIYGENILPQLNINSSKNIPKFEAIRLLFNRNIELLNNIVIDKEIVHKSAFNIWAKKALIAIVESELIFDNKCTSSIETMKNSELSKSNKQISDVFKYKFYYSKDEQSDNLTYISVSKLLINQLDKSLKKYLNNKKDLEDNLQLFFNARHKKLNSLLYLFKIFPKRKVPINCIFRPIKMYFHISAIYFAVAILENDEKYLDKSLKLLNNVLPMNYNNLNNFYKKAEYLRNELSTYNKFSPDISYENDKQVFY